MRLIFLVLAVLPLIGRGQIAWTWTELDTMPFRTTNNAVVEAEVSGVKYVYSFAGIDATKVYSGIHLRAARYNAMTGVWDTLAPLPDTLGKIACGASYVNDKIYIIGGYHVLQNGSELSSDKVHIYNPVTNSYEADGAPVSVPIDDQVQAVWRDSLIYVVTGWSNTGNVPDVQIYNPYTDSWAAGTSTPNNNFFRAFGASGTIIGDTIYYNGGAAGSFQFVNRPYLRKGVINPNDPTDITWTQESDNPGDAGYRMACVLYGDKVFWIGGAGTAYNYDGVAYNGSGGVSPMERILHYDVVDEDWNEGLGAPYGVMDLRGIARISSSSWVICGGMMSNQEVTNRAFLLTYDPVIGGKNDIERKVLKAYPNPTHAGIVKLNQVYSKVELRDVSGRLVLRVNDTNFINTEKLPAGSYYVKAFNSGILSSSILVVIR